MRRDLVEVGGKTLVAPAVSSSGRFVFSKPGAHTPQPGARAVRLPNRIEQGEVHGTGNREVVQR
jgi:hypothetical protein